MATRSIVGTYTDNGQHWRGRYVHWDGSPETRVPVLRELVKRDGPKRVMQTIARYRGWSSLEPGRTHEDGLEDGYTDGRFENVHGYGVAYTVKQCEEDRWEDDTNPEGTWCEYAYIFTPEGNVDVYSLVQYEDCMGWEKQYMAHMSADIPV